MMTYFARVFLCFMIIVLSGCAGHQAIVRSAHEQAQCKIACGQQYNVCRQVCQKNCPLCARAADKSAARHYARYVRERCIQGQVIARELKSYRDPLQCRKTTCNCLADYNVCKQACSGIIQKRLQVAPTCC